MDQLTIRVKDEIRRLRSGRGIFATDLFARMGPHLRTLCGIHDDVSQLRSTLIQQVLTYSGALPDDLQDVLAISLAVDNEVRHLIKFKDRVEHLAERLNTSPRTAQRRIDEAEAQLAVEIATELSRDGSGERFVKSYYVRRYRAIVDNTGAHTESATVVLHQEREIVCIQEGLTEIPIRFELPDHPDTAEPVFSVRVQHGGRLRAQRRLSRTGFELVLGLPTALARREPHRFGLTFTFPAGLLRAHHVITGEVTIVSFELIVKFHPEHLPAWIRRVNGEDIRTLDAFAGQATAPPGEFALDAVGEASQEFHHMSPHLAYGCQYRWPGTPGRPR